MTKFESNGEIFYYDKGNFYDRLFFKLALKDCTDLWTSFLSTIDLRTLKFEEFIELTNQLDSGENYCDCIKIIEKGFEIFFDQSDYAKIMLPKLFRLYRLQGQSQKVIDLWENFWNKKTSLIKSAALYIVLGAAYCDKNSINEAKTFANKAYRLLSGVSNEYLSNLYMRINALDN